MKNLLHTRKGTNQYKKQYKILRFLWTNPNQYRICGLKPNTFRDVFVITFITALVAFVAIDAKASVPQRIIYPIPTYNLIENTPTPTVDQRISKIDNFLNEKDSPLAGYGEYIVGLADKYDIPWTLVVAISGKESSFGAVIKPNSYNAWGVMAWDTKGNRYIRSFSSWEEGIAFETELLSTYYRKNMNEGIQKKYCPTSDGCSKTWVTHVTQFQEEINERTK